MERSLVTVQRHYLWFTIGRTLYNLLPLTCFLSVQKPQEAGRSVKGVGGYFLPTNLEKSLLKIAFGKVQGF